MTRGHKYDRLTRMHGLAWKDGETIWGRDHRAPSPRTARSTTKGTVIADGFWYQGTRQR